MGGWGTVTPPIPLDVLARDLDGQGLDYVIIGGHALRAFGLERYTADIDLVAIDREAVAQRCQALISDGTTLLNRGSIARTVVSPTGRKLVDVLDHHGSKALAFALKNARVVNGVRVPSIEAMMALKFEAMTNGTRATHKQTQDRSDLEYLLEWLYHNDREKANERIQSIAEIIEMDAVGDPSRGKVQWSLFAKNTIADLVIRPLSSSDPLVEP